MLSSFCLGYYENPFVDPGFKNTDPHWIGAWWIGLLLLGVALFLVSFPVAFFPEQNHKVLPTKTISAKQSISNLMKSLKKLAENPILVFHTLSITFQINGIFGYLVFMPKYMEVQYQKSASSASFFSGNVSLTAVAVGIFASGFFIKKFEPKPKYLTGYMLFVQVFAGMVLVAAFFLGCESSNTEVLAQNFSLESKCGNCSCNANTFNPICDMNGIVHFSPCIAGCQNYTLTDEKELLYTDCICTSQLHSTPEKYEASSEFCGKDCKTFLPYIIVISLSKILSSTARVGNVLITLRCVDDKDKSLALGAVEFIISVFASIPYPLLYGYVIDQSCLLWNDTCGRKGNCWLYDNDKFRLYLHGLSITFICMGALCDCVVFFMSSRIQNFYGTSEIQRNLG